MQKSTKANDELKRVASSLSAIAQMSDQIAIAAKEQLDAGEDTAKRIVIISDTASQTADVSNQAHKATDLIKGLTTDLEKETDKFS